MAQILIRNISDDVHARLKEKAAHEGVSLEAYVRGLFAEAASTSLDEILAEADRLRASLPIPSEQRSYEQFWQEQRSELEERASVYLPEPIKPAAE